MNRSFWLLTLILIATPAFAGAPPAVRYDFSSVGREVKLESRQKMEAVLSPSAVLPAGPVTGSWVELQDPAGKVLYRVLVHDMLGRVQEAPAEDRQHLVNVEKKIPANSFWVKLPDLPNGKTVVLFASADDQSPATVVARFPVEAQPKK